MAAAAALSEIGMEVTVLEREKLPGGHVRSWDRLFPTLRAAKEVLDFLNKSLGLLTEIICDIEVGSIVPTPGGYTIHCTNGDIFTTGCLVLATGYDLFDARKKEEYGFGIYENVITSADLEKIFREGNQVTTCGGQVPRRVGIIHCVGSRDEKVGNIYCSKVCCVTGVKQAIEIRQMLPDCEIFSFYMDLRMYDRHFEELYFEAQQKWNVNFIRGRLSECAENPDHSIILKTEDTLTGHPLKLTVDLVVLLVGFVPGSSARKITGSLGLLQGTDGFLLPADEHTAGNRTLLPGVFLAGAVKGPACVVDTIADGRATAVEVYRYMKHSEVAK